MAHTFLQFHHWNLPSFSASGSMFPAIRCSHFFPNSSSCCLFLSPKTLAGWNLVSGLRSVLRLSWPWSFPPSGVDILNWSQDHSSLCTRVSAWRLDGVRQTLLASAHTPTSPTPPFFRCVLVGPCSWEQVSDLSSWFLYSPLFKWSLLCDGQQLGCQEPEWMGGKNFPF